MPDIPQTNEELGVKICKAMDAVWGRPVPLFKNWKYTAGDSAGLETWKFFIGSTIPTGYAVQVSEIGNGWLKMHAGAEDNYGWDYEVHVECITNGAVDFTLPLGFLKKYMEQMKMESMHKLTPELLGT